MNVLHSPGVQKSTPFAPLDLATRQAVSELAIALRQVKGLEREQLDKQSVLYRENHRRRLTNAKARRVAARAALELLLEDDA